MHTEQFIQKIPERWDSSLRSSHQISFPCNSVTGLNILQKEGTSLKLSWLVNQLSSNCQLIVNQLSTTQPSETPKILQWTMAKISDLKNPLFFLQIYYFKHLQYSSLPVKERLLALKMFERPELISDAGCKHPTPAWRVDLDLRFNYEAHITTRITPLCLCHWRPSCQKMK